MLFYTLIVLSLCPVILVGCARELPLISHAHVGHALTAWRGTPNEEGLFVIAEKEAEIALQQTQSAMAASNATVARQHLASVIHALDPERMAKGLGLGYGGIRALTGAANHLQFAAESDDASRNIVRGSEVFVAQAAAVIENFKLAVDVAALAQQAPNPEIPGLAAEIEPIIKQALNGADLDGDGTLGNATKEIGLKQMREQLSTMLLRENPSYHPLGRHHLFGLVRMPNGRWAYQFGSGQSGSDSGYGGR